MSIYLDKRGRGKARCSRGCAVISSLTCTSTAILLCCYIRTFPTRSRRHWEDKQRARWSASQYLRHAKQGGGYSIVTTQAP